MKELTKEQMEQVRSTFPEWFNQIEAGKWYKNKSNTKSIIFNTGVKNGCYGFNNSGKWTNEYEEVTLTNLWEEATPEEVKQALIAEAKWRYKVGDRLSKIYEDCAKCENRCFGERKFTIEDGKLYMHNDISNYGYCIFYNGQWASVISQEKPSLQDDIQALKDRWPDINFTIIAEGKK